MTVIIGYTDGNNVHMIADSTAVDGDFIQNIVQPKIFKINVAGHDMLIGYTSSFRMGQILQFYLKEKLLEANINKDNIYEFLCTTFIENIRAIFKEHGFQRTGDNQSEYGGTFLIGCMGRLFTVQDNYAVLEFKGNFASVGCAEPLATASLATFEIMKNYLPKNWTHDQRAKFILTNVLSVVSKYNAYIDFDNYTILSI